MNEINMVPRKGMREAAVVRSPAGDMVIREAPWGDEFKQRAEE